MNDVDKLVRLTFPAYDIGSTDILCNGKRVGFTLAEHSGWRAYLFPEATDRRIRPVDCEEVTAETLGELRKLLRKRVADEGPWWR